MAEEKEIKQEENAQEKESESTGKRSIFRRLVVKLLGEPIRYSVGAVVVLFSFYLVLSLVSFFFTGWKDQSLLQGDFTDDYLAENIQNWTGLRGAILSDFLVNRTFGIPIFAYVFFLAVVGARMLGISVFKDRMSALFINCSFILIWGSVFLGSFIEAYDSSFIFLGGEHGYQLNLWLRANVGWVGVVLLLFITLFLFLFYAVEGFFEKVSGWTNSLFSKKPNVEANRVDGDDDDKPQDGKDSESESFGSESENSSEDGSENSVTNSVQEGEDNHSEKENIEGSQSNDVDDSTDVANGSKEFPFEEKEHEADKQGDLSFSSDPSTEGEVEGFGVGDSLSTESVDENIQETQVSNDSFERQGDVDENVQYQNNEGGVDFTIEKKEVEKIVTEQDLELYDPTKTLENYKKPTIDLLKEYTVPANIDIEEQNRNKNRIVEVLRSFDVEVSTIKATVGPTVTLYEITLAPGVKIAKIRGLGNDIALAIAAKGIRIIAPIPGKGTVGIEVPNAKPVTVSMAEIIGSVKFQESKFELPIALGKTITNEVFMLDLCKMPHVLVAGATGQGKSVGLNAIITSLLYKKHPTELKFVMVDPKMVEFSMYAPIERHFLAKMENEEDAIITDVKKVVQTLNSLCIEMDNRYELLKDAHVRQIKEYNEKFVNRQLNPLKGHHYMPYIVVIIDEFADLIMTVGKEVETPIARIAQKARAVGIHMILATQRPSANIVTGVIRANFPARFAFKVSSGLESRVILDQTGADQLIGRGDMLVSAGNDTVRVQCAFVDTPEVERITDYISKQQGEPSAFLLPEYKEEGEEKVVDLKSRDVLFDQVAEFVVSSGQGSTSFIQRKWEIGYNRAGRIMDQLEAANIVGPARGSKPREVLVKDMAQLDAILQSL